MPASYPTVVKAFTTKVDSVNTNAADDINALQLEVSAIETNVIGALTTANGVLAAGTTATGAFQNTGAGTTGQVLTSNGAAAKPTFQASVGIQPAYTAKTANYTAVANDLVSATSGTFTVTLPAAASNANKAIWVVNNGTGTITIGRTGSDTVGLATSQTLNPATATAQGDSMAFISDGISNWDIF